MATASHHAPPFEPKRHVLLGQILVREMWASLAIAVIWLAVMFDAIFGPDFVSTTAGASTTRIPSAIIVAVFAWLATSVIARRAFGRGGSEKD